MKLTINVDYRQKRRDRYPTIGDQLDAIWKVLAENPDALPADTRAMLEKVQSVKTEVPKPKGALP